MSANHIRNSPLPTPPLGTGRAAAKLRRCRITTGRRYSSPGSLSHTGGIASFDEQHFWARGKPSKLYDCWTIRRQSSNWTSRIAGQQVFENTRLQKVFSHAGGITTSSELPKEAHTTEKEVGGLNRQILSYIACNIFITILASMTVASPLHDLLRCIMTQ